MMRRLPYIMAGIAALALLLLLAGSARQERRLDERITLRQRDKIPYGSFAVRQVLPHLFPNARISSDNRAPSDWDSLRASSYNQAVILMSREFNADEEEVNRLVTFAGLGNFVFIITRTLSYDANRLLRVMDGSHGFEEMPPEESDSLKVQLQPPLFPDTVPFDYPGRRYESIFTSLDTVRNMVLGRDAQGQPNFIQLNTGQGRIFIHLAPVAFSNYFVLHQNNSNYLQAALSVIPENVERIVWNEYYLVKPRYSQQSSSGEGKKEEPQFLRVLLQYPSFRWGLATALATLLLFALLELRRKQRPLVPYPKPKNDSLDFVKTMGRLYYDRRDHANLARKMSVYFLDHVRMRYKLPVHTLDPAFVQVLHAKSGYPPEPLGKLVGFIRYIQTHQVLSEWELSGFHQQLENFYQNT